MRARLLLAVAALLSTAGVSATHADTEPGPGYFKTANVDYLGTIPLDADSAGGRLLGTTFYVLTAKGLTIYDVSNPELPVPIGATVLPHTPNQEREDVDTNGKILIAGQSYLGVLYVVDVSNPATPRLLATAPSADHTNTCALDCTYVYGSDGHITDLRDPANPKVLEERWTDSAGVGGSHDLTEIRPGILVTASNPITYLDVRSDPAHPTLLATGALPTDVDYYTHGVAWPRAGADRWLLAGTESGYGCGTPEEGSFQVFDTRAHRATREFRFVGRYTLEKGLPTEGKAEVNELCGHWFTPHPDFRDGGLVAMAWYGFGTRFIEVTRNGEIVEKGHFVPTPGHTSSSYWITEDIVYSLDYTARGFDILRFDPTKPAEVDEAHPGRFTRASATTSDARVAPSRAERFYVCPVPAA